MLQRLIHSARVNVFESAMVLLFLIVLKSLFSNQPISLKKLLCVFG